MISERTLKQWRKEALIDIDINKALSITEGTMSFQANTKVKLGNRILRMTQELLDLYLIKK